MSKQDDDHGIVVLDACCVLNLYATGRMEGILERLPWEFAVVQYVAEQEVLYVGDREATEDSGQREEVILEPLVDSGLLTVLDYAGEDEMALAVRLATELDDGEAMTCAIAAARGGAVATDDRKALRLLAARNPPIPTYRTTQLLSSWAKPEEVSELELKEVLLAISERACYVPAKVDPLRSWWLQIVGEG